jgi:DNA-directed RNA polymerase specialized sigma subunit
MFWIEEFYNLEYRIESIDQQIIRIAEASYSMSVDKSSRKIIDLMLDKNKLINKYFEYEERFNELQPKIKTMFELRYKENKTFKQIAEELKTSIRTVQRWISLVKEE